MNLIAGETFIHPFMNPCTKTNNKKALSKKISTHFFSTSSIQLGILAVSANGEDEP